MAAKPEGVHSRVQFAFQPGGPYPSHCGYCHGQVDSFLADGIWAEDMTVQDFQDLVDRGCQRSGKFVYLPCNKITCCPQYVMRLDSGSFRISKQQRRVIRRFKEYLATGKVSGMPNGDDQSLETGEEDMIAFGEGRQDETDFVKEKSGDSTHNESVSTQSVDENKPAARTIETTKKNTIKPGAGANPNLPPCRKAKVIRQEKKAKKVKDGNVKNLVNAKVTSPSPVPMEAANVETPQKKATDVSAEMVLPDQGKHKFTVKLVCVNPKSEEYDNTLQQSYEVFRKFQMIIHKEPEEKCQKFHFTQFCVDSPLICEPSGIPGLDYGSYHQQYWIDDTLVMVGVLDFLPQGVLCNYLYYDPHFRFLAPGVFSALYEIAQTQKYSKSDPRMQYYYMGYYVHDCPKMNYKRFYDSSYVLCPETLEYVILPKCRAKLDNSKYCRLSDRTEVTIQADNEEIQKEEEQGDTRQRNSGKVLVFSYDGVMTYEDYARSRGTHYNQLVHQYIDMVGNDLANKMVLYFYGLVGL